MRTRLTDILEIDHPVMLAGMGGVSYSTLVAAVSEAGGFGCMGASGAIRCNFPRPLASNYELAISRARRIWSSRPAICASIAVVSA